MALNKGKVHFTLAGYNFNPDEITEILGIEPTSFITARTHGAMSDNPAISSWVLSTDNFTDEIDVFSMTSDLIKQIEPVKDKIKTAIEGYNLVPKIKLDLLLSVDKEENVPEVGFGSRTIKFLSEIGAFIEIDYKLSERI